MVQRVNVERLLIVRLGAMGDIVHTLPAATALRNAFPRAVIGWIVEERWVELLCGPHAPPNAPRSPQKPLVDRIHVVNTSGWRAAPLSARTWKELRGILSEIRNSRYDVAVDFQGAVRSALLARLSKAPVLYGAAQPRENVASVWYTRQVQARGAHIIEQNLSLARAITQRNGSVPQVQFPSAPEVEEEVIRRLRSQGIGDFAILSPGAGWGAKQWPAERYGYVARKLAETGLTPLINAGPGEEVLALAAEAASHGVARALTCSLTELIALMRQARLFVGGDTGPLHLAAALGIPVVGIFGPTNPSRNGPYATSCVVLRNAASPTTHTRYPEPDEGMLEISADDVVAAATDLLARTAGGIDQSSDSVA